MLQQRSAARGVVWAELPQGNSLFVQLLDETVLSRQAHQHQGHADVGSRTNLDFVEVGYDLRIESEAPQPDLELLCQGKMCGLGLVQEYGDLLLRTKEPDDRGAVGDNEVVRDRLDFG